MDDTKARHVVHWFLFLFLSLFYWISLATYSPSDPSFNSSGSGHVSNWCGIVGAYVSDIFIQLFGVLSFLFPFFFLLYMLKKHGKASGKHEVSLFFFTLSLLFLLSSVSLSGKVYPYTTSLGGGFGEVIHGVLVRYLGNVGYLVLAFCCLGASLFPFASRWFRGLRKDVIPTVVKRKKGGKGVKKEDILPESSSTQSSSGAGYTLPPVELLSPPERVSSRPSKEEFTRKARLIEEKLRDFKIDGKVVNVRPGPVVTTFEYQPAPGIKISKISTLQDDLAMALQALSLRIIAPVPGKSVIGFEVPNDVRETVYLREIIESPAFKRSSSPLTLALGKDIFGEPYVADLAKMPHLLVAGATGSGKSVALNTMIMSILYKASPQDVKFIMVDPKMLELSSYEAIPHLLHPVVVDPKKAAHALSWAVQEMERRYGVLSGTGARDIVSYNSKVSEEERMPYIVIVIDELSDLIMVSSKEVEEAITRLAQMARASGIHMIVATQRPSVDVISGLIKANFPTRISFRVSSRADSKTILDGHGAEKLLGMGDMLFVPPGESRPIRLHGPFVSDDEVERVVSHVRAQGRPEYLTEITSGSEEEGEISEDEVDELFHDAVEFAKSMGYISVSLLQRRFRIGYNRAARIVEEMERRGMVGPSDGVKPRKVLVK